MKHLLIFEDFQEYLIVEKMYLITHLYGHHVKLGQRKPMILILVLIQMLALLEDIVKKAELGEKQSKKGLNSKYV
jgi:hypothetical protein